MSKYFKFYNIIKTSNPMVVNKLEFSHLVDDNIIFEEKRPAFITSPTGIKVSVGETKREIKLIRFSIDLREEFPFNFSFRYGDTIRVEGIPKVGFIQGKLIEFEIEYILDTRILHCQVEFE